MMLTQPEAKSKWLDNAKYRRDACATPIHAHPVLGDNLNKRLVAKSIAEVSFRRWAFGNGMKPTK